jgi:hypothetical protein
MTRFIHDQFAKQYLRELLKPFGEVETSLDVVSEVRQIDVFFVPFSPHPGGIEQLGLLGELIPSATVFEPFRNPVKPEEIRSCLGKSWDLEAELRRKANREDTEVCDRDIAQLWILSPTASENLLRSFAAFPQREHHPPGIYPFAPGFKAGIIVIHQLSKIPETLWLRLLGKGRVQKEAISELKDLPEVHPFRGKTLELLYGLLMILEKRQDLDESDRELMMELSTIYLQQLETANQQGLQQGIQQGIQQGLQQGVRQGQRLMIESMLQVKFGEIDDQLAQMIDPLIELSPLERTQAIMNLSRQELLDRFNQT